MTKKSLVYAALVFFLALLLDLYPVDILGVKSIKQANQLLKDGQPFAAMDQFENLIYLYPEKTYLYQRTGEAAFLAGEVEKAKSYLDFARTNKELDEKGLMILGDIHQQNGNWREAISVWKMIGLNKQNVNDVSIRLSNVFISKAMWIDADLTLKNQLNYFPDNGETGEMLGWIDLFIDPGKARMIFNDLSAGTENSYRDVINRIDKYPEIIDDAQQECIWWLEVGDLAAKYDHPDIALKAFEKSTQVNGKYAVGWMKTALQKQSMELDVEKEIALAENLGDNDPIANAMLAEYWYAEMKPELSIIYLHKALEIDPNSQYSSLRLGQILSEIGNINEGLQYIKQSALQLNTGTGWKSVIIYCLENGIYIQDEALPAVRKALSLEPDSSEILDLAGQIFVAIEDDITAERYFEQAIAKDKYNYLAHLHIGSLLARIGYTEKARDHLTIAAQQSDDFDISDQAKQILTTIQAE